MIYEYLFNGHSRFGTSPGDICQLAFNCAPDAIREDVIVAPFWGAEIFEVLADSVVLVSESNLRKVWTVSASGREITFIRTGVGSPVLIDAVLALSCTPCKNILFIGSVGGLIEGVDIGHVLIPEYSVSGDGASRYLTDGKVKDHDCFGERQYPDPGAFAKLSALTKSVSAGNNVVWHIGKTFSVDSIFAEFAHLEEIEALGCDSIEMETAALFKAAKISGLKAAALFNVSDNVYWGKSVYVRTDEDLAYRDYVRNKILTAIVLEYFKGE